MSFVSQFGALLTVKNNCVGCVCVRRFVHVYTICGTSLYRLKERPELSVAFEFDPWTSIPGHQSGIAWHASKQALDNLEQDSVWEKGAPQSHRYVPPCQTHLANSGGKQRQVGVQGKGVKPSQRQAEQDDASNRTMTSTAKVPSDC